MLILRYRVIYLKLWSIGYIITKGTKMITIKISSAVRDSSISGGLIVCPECLSDIYLFHSACCECGAETFEGKAVVSNGVAGRVTYHRLGWPSMDRMSIHRFKELHRSN